MSTAAINGSTKAVIATTTGSLRARSLPRQRLRQSPPPAVLGSCCGSRCSWRPVARTRRAASVQRGGVFALRGAPDSYISFIHIDDAAAAVVAALEAPAGTYNVAEPDPVRRANHCYMLGSLVGGSGVLERPDGNATSSVARSHRISSQHLQDVSTWSPSIHCVDRWKELQ